MKTFLQRFGGVVRGVLHGFDRIRFRGSKRQLCHVAGMMSWLGHVRILLKEFKAFARDTTVRLCQSIEAPAEQAGRYRFLNSSQESKEETALRLAAEQGRTAWPELLERWAQASVPALAALLPCPVPYYWSVETGEYATDFAFETAAELARVYPLLVRQASTILHGTNLLRFLGYRVRQDGQPYRSLAGEVTTRVKELVEGTCVKHTAVNNQLKMYDKFGQVLRLETSLHNLRDFKVYRAKEGQPDGPKENLRMRQGVADMHGRAEVCAKINERYAAGLATVTEPVPLGELTKDLGKRGHWKGRPVRPLNPLAPADVALLEAVLRGEFAISGFRNRDLRGQLYPTATDTSAADRRRQAARVTRLLRLLRGHGLIAKIPKTHRYQLTDTGRSTVTALLAARRANTQQLLQAA